MQLYRQPVSGNAHRLQKFLSKNFPRMHRPTCRTFILDAHSFPRSQTSVVIRYLYMEGVTILPDEAYAELVVDPDTVLAFSIPVQSFQSVAGRDSQILQLSSRVEHGQFLPGRASQVRRRHSLALACVPKLLRAFIREGLDHFSQLNECRY